MAWIENLRRTDRRFSLRWLAKRLEIKSHTHLLSLASRHKAPTEDLLERLCDLAGFTVDEAAYLKGLASLQRVKQPQERAFLLERLAGLKRRSPETLVALDAFAMISHWYHLAIFELVALPG